MMNRATRNSLSLALLSLSGSLLLACGGPDGTSEAALRAWVVEAQALAEEKKRRPLVDFISPDYGDARGNEREDIENMLRLYFLRQHNIKLLTTVDEIRLYDDSAAEVDLTVGMAATNDGVLGFSADAYRFEMELVRDGGDWSLISARWGEVGGEIR